MTTDDQVSERFSSITSGQTIGRNGSAAESFSLQVQQNGSGASWTVVLEGSLDGVNFTTILTHTDLDPGDGQIIYSGAAKYPCTFHRVRVVSLSLGTSTEISVRSLGL